MLNYEHLGRNVFLDVARSVTERYLHREQERRVLSELVLVAVAQRCGDILHGRIITHSIDVHSHLHGKPSRLNSLFSE